MMTPQHLENIDASSWPGIVTVPAGLKTKLLARRAEAEFARACAKAGLNLDPADGEADIVVDYEELFPRIAAAGWLGLAESYLAGEWQAPQLADALARLLSAGWSPRSVAITHRPYSGSQLPPELVKFSTGGDMGLFAGVFSSGVPTTVREAVESFAPGAGRGAELARHFVDVTTYAPPAEEVERADLPGAQLRAVEKLLDAAGVHSGTHLLDQPAVSGTVAVAAARRRAIVDAVTSDPRVLQHIDDATMLAGVENSVHAERAEGVIPGRRGRYEAIISVEFVELLGPRALPEYLRAVDRLLAPGGHVAVQSYIATEKMSDAGRKALSVLRAYVWPSLKYPTAHEVYRVVDRNTGLRVVAEERFGSHAAVSLGLAAEEFWVRRREAAAEGFDPVFRRLWRYQFALREALLRLGMLDCVQWTLTHRNRKGRR